MILVVVCKKVAKFLTKHHNLTQAIIEDVHKAQTYIFNVS